MNSTQINLKALNTTYEKYHEHKLQNIIHYLTLDLKKSDLLINFARTKLRKKKDLPHSWREVRACEIRGFFENPQRTFLCFPLRVIFFASKRSAAVFQ